MFNDEITTMKIRKNILFLWLVGFIVPPVFWVIENWYLGLWNTEEMIKVIINPVLIVYVSVYIFMTWCFLLNRLNKIEIYRKDQNPLLLQNVQAITASLPKAFLFLITIYCLIGPNMCMLGQSFINSTKYILGELLGIPFILIFSIPFFILLTIQLERLNTILHISANNKALKLSGKVFLSAFLMFLGGTFLIFLSAYCCFYTASSLKLGLYDLLKKGPIIILITSIAAGFVTILLTRQVELARQEALSNIEALYKLQESQAALIQSSKMNAIGQLAAGVAHEINNPLSGVLGHAKNIIRYAQVQKLDQQEPVKKLLEWTGKIVRDAERCKGITSNLLSFSRQDKTHMTSLKVSKVISDTVQLIGAKFRASKIDLKIEVDESIPIILGSESKLQQVFINLLINAEHATPAGGKVIIKTTLSEDGLVLISFHDTGEGIPKENLERIFDAFFTTKLQSKGTGLGLSICYGIIQEHGGYIQVESVVGAGSIFTVCLPSIEQK